MRICVYVYVLHVYVLYVYVLYVYVDLLIRCGTLESARFEAIIIAKAVC